MLPLRSLIKLWLIGILVALTACKTTDKKEAAAAAKDAYTCEKDLVTEGESAEPAYSPDGTKLLFVSRDRKGHKTFQVYEKDLASGAERRFTFQNGNVSGPRYHPKAPWMLYASSTDELKEEPPRLDKKKPDPKVPQGYRAPNELYLHSLGGLEIVRLTHHVGFDGEARFSSDGAIITHTRANGDELETLAINRASSTARPLKGKGTAQYVQGPKVQAWVEWNDDLTSATVKLQQGKASALDVSSTVSPKYDLTFSPDHKWLIWAEPGVDGKLEIWGAELQGGTPRLLVSASEDRRHPTVSPDNKTIAFTSWRKGRSRIALLPFPTTPDACASAPK